MGITNCIATIPGFVAPAVVGYLTNDQVRIDLKRKMLL